MSSLLFRLLFLELVLSRNKSNNRSSGRARAIKSNNKAAISPAKIKSPQSKLGKLIHEGILYKRTVNVLDVKNGASDNLHSIPRQIDIRVFAVDKEDLNVFGEENVEKAINVIENGMKDGSSFEMITNVDGKEYRLCGFSRGDDKLVVIAKDYTDVLKEAPGVKMKDIESAMVVINEKLKFVAGNKQVETNADKYNEDNDYTPKDKGLYARPRKELVGEDILKYLKGKKAKKNVKKYYSDGFAGKNVEIEMWANLKEEEKEIEPELKKKRVRISGDLVSGKGSNRHTITDVIPLGNGLYVSDTDNLTRLTDIQLEDILSKNPRDLFNSHFRDPNSPTYAGAVDEGQMTQKIPSRKDHIPLPNPFPTFMLPAFLLTAGAISSNERVFQKGAAGSRWGNREGPAYSGEGKNPDSDNQQPSFYPQEEENDASSYNKVPLKLQLPDGALVFHFIEENMVEVKKENKQQDESEHLITTQNAEKARNENNIDLKVPPPNTQKEGEKNSVKTPVPYPDKQLQGENDVKIQVPSAHKQLINKQILHDGIAQKAKEQNDIALAQKLKWENDIKNPISHKQKVNELQRSLMPSLDKQMAGNPHKNDIAQQNNTFLSIPCLVDSRQPSPHQPIQAGSLIQETTPAKEHLNGQYTHESIHLTSSSSIPPEKLPPEKPKAVARQSVVKGPENLPIIIAMKRKRVKKPDEGHRKVPGPIRARKAKTSPTIIVRKRGKTKRKKRGKKTEGKKKSTGRRKKKNTRRGKK